MELAKTDGTGVSTADEYADTLVQLRNIAFGKQRREGRGPARFGNYSQS